MWCRRPCGPGVGPYSEQHRLPRGDGGTSLEVVNGAANLVLLCGHATQPGGCHYLAEHRRAWALACGYLLRHGSPRHPTVPAAHRVWRHGRWVLLGDDGTVTALPDSDPPPAPPGLSDPNM